MEERSTRIEKLETFLKMNFPNMIQAFNTRNIAGDSMDTIYEDNDIIVDNCYYWEYIEIFGLTKDEFNSLKSKKIVD